MPATCSPVPKVPPKALLVPSHTALVFLGSLGRAIALLSADTAFGVAVFSFWYCVPWLLSAWATFQMRIRSGCHPASHERPGGSLKYQPASRQVFGRPCPRTAGGDLVSVRRRAPGPSGD
ncbi:hypothetical protein OKW43_007488 [Paraburkholderia sp. WC7.3g]